MTTKQNSVTIGRMDIRYTRHANVRMLQRKIRQEDIESAIQNPDTTREAIQERVAARKKLSKGTLEVIYKKSISKIVIITCYWVKEG